MSSISSRKDGIFDPQGKYPNPLTGQPYTNQYFSHSLGINGWAELAVWKSSIEIIKKIHNHSILLLQLPTGVGKTVIIPKLLLHYFNYSNKVLVTTPRQTTTANAGLYASKCLDVPLYYVDDNGIDILNNEIKDKNEARNITGIKIVGYKYQGKGNRY